MFQVTEWTVHDLLLKSDMYTPQNDALKMYFIEYYTAPKDFGGLFFISHSYRLLHTNENMDVMTTLHFCKWIYILLLSGKHTSSYSVALWS